MKAYTQKRIRELLDEAIAKGETAGAGLLLIKDGQEIHFEARGHANKEQQKPFRRDTIVRLFSMTKPVTAVAAMLLMEQGRLDLAAPVADLLPGFKADHIIRDDKRITISSPMTAYHLLNMTAGLTYGDLSSPNGRATLSYLGQCQAQMYGPDALTTRAFALGLGELPLAYEPDSSWSYGLCADVMGAIIEAVSGVSFGAFLRDNILLPLGMTDTAFYVPEEKQSRLADGYLSTGKGDILPFTKDNLVISYRMDQPPAFESGGAGLVSTINDYARFARMLLNGGELEGKRILSPATVAYMTSPGLTPVQKDALRARFGLEGHSYGNFLRIKEDTGSYSGLSRPGEYGWDGWMGCYFANFPREKVSLVLTQQKAESGTTPLTKKLRNVILADPEVFSPVPAKV